MLNVLLGLVSSYYDVNAKIYCGDNYTTLKKQIEYATENCTEDCYLLLAAIIDPQLNKSIEDLSEIIAELSGYYIPFK